MGRFFTIIAIVAAVAFVGNLLAQRLIPTRVGDRLHRRIGYSILVRVIAAACLVALAALASFISR